MLNTWLTLPQIHYPLSAVSIKKGQHSEQWPYPVEVLHKQETIHASLCSEKDRKTLIDCVGRLEGVPTRVGSILVRKCHVLLPIYIALS